MFGEIHLMIPENNFFVKKSVVIRSFRVNQRAILV